jgi:hypothetical protein
MESAVTGVIAGRAAAFAVAMVLAMAGLAPVATSAQPIAVVTDVQGKATLQSAAGSKAAAIPATLQAGDRVTLEPDARLSVLFYATGAGFDARGPGEVSVGAGALTGTARVEPRSTAPGRELKLRTGPLVQGAVVLRALGLRLPASGGTILERSPEFQWTDTAEGATYELTLTDAADNVVHRAQTRARSQHLPPEVVLAEGAEYRLEIVAVGGGRPTQRASSKFTVASAELRHQVHGLAPTADAPVADRVAYALWLEDNRLNDEARKWWAGIAEARPEEAAARRRAAPPR